MGRKQPFKKIFYHTSLAQSGSEQLFYTEKVTGPNPVGSTMKYICDNKRHLICIPYSIDNLHKMAEDLDIKKCWFHKNHYDIPKMRVEEITNKCTLVNSKEIVKIINGKEDKYKRV